MRKHVVRHFGFLKTTLLGGIVFMLPLAVVGWLLGQGAQIVWTVFSAVQQYVSDHQKDIEAYADLDTGGYVSLFAASLVLMLGICFVAGMIARRSLGQWFTGRAERYLTMLFPRYAVFKDQLTGNLGGGTLKPALVRIGPATRVGMEVERDSDGRVIVYLPNSPDPWTGTVQVVSAEDVTAISGEYIDVMTSFEQLGRGMNHFAATAVDGGLPTNRN